VEALDPATIAVYSKQRPDISTDQPEQGSGRGAFGPLRQLFPLKELRIPLTSNESSPMPGCANLPTRILG